MILFVQIIVHIYHHIVLSCLNIQTNIYAILILYFVKKTLKEWIDEVSVLIAVLHLKEIKSSTVPLNMVLPLSSLPRGIKCVAIVRLELCTSTVDVTSKCTVIPSELQLWEDTTTEIVEQGRHAQVHVDYMYVGLAQCQTFMFK